MQAEQWGKADVQTLRNMYRLPDKLANRVKIQCYLPRGLSMDTRPGMKFVPNYWREIFRGFFFHTDVTFQSIWVMEKEIVTLEFTELCELIDSVLRYAEQELQRPQ